ncbi:MAG: hypothetical protein LBD53_06450 [Tannerella sp.]|jgi:hypothetical protein|nr:hypothetical protein [Tannerella sp.]
MSKLGKWDKQHLVNLGLTQKQIDAIFDAAAREAAAIGASLHDFNPDKPFSFADYPQTKARIEKALKTLQKRIETTIVDGVDSAWTLANNKNNALCDRVFGDNKNNLTKEQERRYYSNNDKAREAFLGRKTAGMNLSDRVWNYTDQFKAEIEMFLDIGIGNGKSAHEMALKLYPSLKNPNEIISQYRDKWGQLRLVEKLPKKSSAGVYRSSYKNAFRLARTEVNMAYRTADHVRWQQLDFVVGVEIHLSNNHTLNGVPFYDICDELKGKYPKDFKFVGWHPQCRCFATSVLKTPDELEADNERIMNGEEPTAESVNTVKDMPENFKGWIDKNADRIAAAERRGTLPYFIKDNKGYVLSNGKQSFASIFTEKKYTQEFVDYVNDENRQDVPKRGLVNSAMALYQSSDSVSKYDLEFLLEDYFKAYPSDINGKFGSIDVKNNAKWMMRCVSNKKHHHYIEISDHNFSITKGLKFNPSNELLNAIQMIRNGKTLTFREEYAIEGLWHEILHAKSSDTGKKLTVSQNNSMEAINQFVARKSYHTFLSRLGGKAMHQKEVIKNGFGYGNGVKNLIECFKSCDIKPDDAFKFFEAKIVSSRYEDIEKTLYGYLRQNGLKTSETVFKKMMTDIDVGENEFKVKYL